MSKEPSDVEGLLVATMTLTVGLMLKLRDKGLLTQDEVTQLFDSPMLILEEMGLNGRTLQVAHNFLLKMMDLVSKGDQPNCP